MKIKNKYYQYFLLFFFAIKKCAASSNYNIEEETNDMMNNQYSTVKIFSENGILRIELPNGPLSEDVKKLIKLVLGYHFRENQNEKSSGSDVDENVDKMEEDSTDDDTSSENTDEGDKNIGKTEEVEEEIVDSDSSETSEISERDAQLIKKIVENSQDSEVEKNCELYLKEFEKKLIGMPLKFRVKMMKIVKKAMDQIKASSKAYNSEHGKSNTESNPIDTQDQPALGGEKCSDESDSDTEHVYEEFCLPPRKGYRPPRKIGYNTGCIRY